MRLPLFFAGLLASLPALAAAPAPAPAAAPTPPAATVRVAHPTPAAAETAYSLPGRTEPLESARIFTRATGIVRTRAVDIGDRVAAGEVLAVIDVPDIDRAVEAAKATLEQAEVLAANAGANAARAAALFASLSISKELADQRQADAKATAAAVRVAQANLARLQEQQHFATVRAPFAGVVAARNFERGDRVRGDTATAEGWLYQLVRLDTLHFVVQAAPDLALRLTTGARARVTFTEFPGRAFPATVARFSRVLETATGTMRVELQIDNPELVLPAGLSGSATFALPPAAHAWVVPTNALTLVAGKSTLAIAEAGRVAFLEVLPGRNFGATLEVVSPALSAQSAVILNPNALLRAGDRVAVESPRLGTPSQ